MAESAPQRVSGAEIEAWREQHGVSKNALAQLLGVEAKTVRTWEQTRRRPTGTTWKVLHILIRGTRGERGLMIGLLNTYTAGTVVR